VGEKVKRVSVGPFRVTRPLGLGGKPVPASREDLVRRSRRHLRSVASGGGPAVSPDESVRITPRSDTSDQRLSGGRRRFLDSDNDDDNED